MIFRFIRLHISRKFPLIKSTATSFIKFVTRESTRNLAIKKKCVMMNALIRKIIMVLLKLTIIKG